MANLIIKSSADNLVLQGSDASPAITVGATGTTTFAENTTFASGKGMTLTSSSTFPAGHVLQVKSATKRDVFSSSSVNDAWTAIPDLLIAITPSSTSSKFLVQYNANIAMATGSHSGVATGLYRDGTIITGAKAETLLSNQEAVTTVSTHYNHSDANIGNDVHSMSFLDSPTIPSTPIAITYQVYLFNASSNAFVSYVNRTQSDGTNIYVTRGASTISVMEVAG